MNSKLLPAYLVTSVLLWGNHCAVAQQTPLVRIRPEGEKPRVGVILKDDAEAYHILDLKSFERIVIGKENVKSIRTVLSYTSAAKTVGLANLIAWKIKQEFLNTLTKGKVASVKGSQIFITLGERTGVKQGHELEVFRGNNLIKDPDTGETLGVQRRKIAKLVVTEVREAYSKAKLQGELEIEVRPGDIVERTAVNNSLAFIPFVNTDGVRTAAGTILAETLTTELVNHEIPIVERKRLDAVISEMALQQTQLFETSKAQDIGRQTGARGILTGTIISGRRKDVAQIRLIEVKSGSIVFSLEHELEETATDVASRTANPVVLNGTINVRWQPRGHTKYLIQGEKIFAFYSNGKHLCKTGRLRDGSLTCERPDGNVTVFRRKGDKVVAESYPSKQYLSSGKTPTKGTLE